MKIKLTKSAMHIFVASIAADILVSVLVCYTPSDERFIPFYMVFSAVAKAISGYLKIMSNLEVIETLKDNDPDMDKVNKDDTQSLDDIE